MKEAERIVADYLLKGWDSKPYERMMALALGEREAVVLLVEAVLKHVPKGGTFLDGALSFLTEDEFARAIELAMRALGEDVESDAAASVIAYGSVQLPHLLEKHLLVCWSLRPNQNTYYESWPWRGSNHAEVTRLLEITGSRSGDVDRAWTCLLEAREPALVEQAARALSTRQFHYDGWLNHMGFAQGANGIVRLHSRSARHIQFPNGFLDENEKPPWLSTTFHPTWSAPSSEVALSFGGNARGVCAFCDGTLHRLFELPSHERVDGGKTPLNIATCLSCLGWAEPILFYAHDATGHPRAINPDGRRSEPEFKAGPLRATQARLVQLPERWAVQDWALSNSRENLNRVGGAPSWIQDAHYPRCVGCGQTMSFVAQLDSELPTEDGDEWLWGSGGIGYIFWCGPCSISATSWQCT